ncbi:MAG: LuxR C-terminal-related transcriptional regulator [Planctomycetaceae bacterium]
MTFECWDILTTLPGVGVSIVDRSGCYVYANEQYCDILLGGASPIQGRTVAELFGEEMGLEYDAIASECLRTGEALTVYATIRSRALEVTCWAMRPVPNEPRRIISVCRELVRQVKPRSGPGVRVIHNVDLGTLATLTRRELSVLTLLGHGMLQKQIANLMKVSQRTVERHRTRISQKLGTRSLAEIAQFVQVAGLRVDPPHD